MSTGHRRALAAAASVVVAVLALAGPAAHAQSTAPSGDEPVILRVGLSADLTTDNVFAVSAGSDYTVATTEYDMLQKFAVADATAAPSLATGCDHNEDYTQWTCTLRDGVLWSDGTPLTSEDVAFSYRFVIDNKIPQYKSYFPGNPVFTTPDPLTFVWTADEPTFAPSMPPWVYIVPEHVWSQYDGQSLKDIRAVSGMNPVVSGPYMLTGWEHGQGFTMDRNPNFWGPEPTVDRVDYRVYTNQEAMIQALKNNEIDIADGLTPSLINSVSNTPNISVQKVVSDWWLNLAFNFGGQNDDRGPVARAARPDGPQGDRDGDRQVRDRQQGVPRSGHAGRYDRSARVGVLASRHPDRSGGPVRSGRGERPAG